MRVLWRLPSAVALLLVLGACVAPTANTVGETETPVAPTESQYLSLIATDLVGTLIQVPEYNPVVTTVQFAKPSTLFGERLLAAVREAGYGVQLVEGDLGPNYVSYAERHSDTDMGKVTDYLVNINALEIRREYRTTASGVYPASLMYVSGLESEHDFTSNDWFFAEQGGDESFVSGVDTGKLGNVGIDNVQEIVADKNEAVRADRRTRQEAVLDDALKKMHEAQKEEEAHVTRGFQRVKKMVILFSDNTTLSLGASNKAAIREFVALRQPGDIVEIAACDDVDGENEMAEQRAVRVKEELQAHAIPLSSLYRSPCMRASYRHASDDSPVPVALYLLRGKATGGN